MNDRERMNKLAEEIKKLFGDEAKEIKIKLLHTRAVNAYVRKIEEAHKKAANSKLEFDAITYTIK